jgi:hypothetical protein
LIAAALGIVGLLLLIAALAALLRLRLFRFAFRAFLASALLALGALVAGLGFGLQGYRALTHEELAATIRVAPVAPQRFAATARLADGRELTFDLAGDEIVVDAHVLKWTPAANLIGLHTTYQLDRIAGRYRAITDERGATRTVHSLSAGGPVDLFDLRRRYAFLSPLFDAEYGSASFVPVNRPADLEVRVSTTGLLIREKKTS